MTRGKLTSEHLLALAVEDGDAGLKRLLAQEVGKGDRDGVRRAGTDGLRDGSRRGTSLLTLRTTRRLSLALLLLLLMLSWGTLRLPLAGRAASLLLLLHLLLHLHLLHVLDLGHALLADVLDKVLDRHAVLCGLCGELLLHLLDLLWRGHLLAWHRAWHWHAATRAAHGRGAVGVLHRGQCGVCCVLV